MLALTRTFRLTLILSLALLVAACGSASPPGARKSSGTTPTTAPTSSPTPPANQVIQALWMSDTATGWAMTSGDHRLLRTTDGGMSWRDVTPPYSRSPQAMDVVADFLSASLAWVAIAPDNGTPPTQVYRTTDGGQTWQMATVTTTSQLGHLTFLDSRHGWLLAGIQAAAGPKAVDVFRTTDGGATWTKVSTASPTYTSPNALPPGAEWLAFADASTGWATGSSPVSPPFVWLYVTHDGGSTWQHQTLLPPAQGQRDIFTGPITFFNNREGVLPTCLVAGADIYVTHDGGTTWNSTSLLPLSQCALAPAADFIDSTHGWVLDNPGVTPGAAPPRSLYMTSDGGAHWTKLSTSTNFTSIHSLDFVSDHTGWAVSSFTSDSSILLKTVDGGQVWTPIQYHVTL